MAQREKYVILAIVGVVTQFQLKIPIFLRCAKFSKSIQIFATFTIGMTGNKTRHLLECVELYGKFINKNET